MLRYLIKRLIYMVPTLFGMSVVAFMLIQLPPGDYLNRCAIDDRQRRKRRSGPDRCAAGRFTAPMTRSRSSTGSGSAASCSAATSATRSSGSGRWPS